MRLREFAPDSFGGDEGFNERMAAAAQEDGIRLGVSLNDSRTFAEAIKINAWDSIDGGMYIDYFKEGWIEGRKDKIQFDNKQYGLNLRLRPDGSIVR